MVVELSDDNLYRSRPTIGPTKRRMRGHKGVTLEILRNRE